MNVYENLISKLDSFIKKYYKIKILRGLIIFTALFILLWIIVSFSEFYLHFSVNARTFIFIFLIVIFSAIFIFFILLPILKLFKIGKRINYKQASNIISKHFPDVKDKLLNILELHEQNENEKNVLIEASVVQKSEEIKIFPFTSAVKYSSLKKYLKYAIPVFLIFISAFLISPTIFKESTKHIINYKKEFKEPPPFSFLLQNNNLNIKKGSDLTLKLKVKGKYIPDEVYINYGGSSFLMKKNKKIKTDFSYEFKNLYNSVDFYFSSQNIKSQKYFVNILPAPSVKNFIVNINVPEYTGEKDTVLNNINDIVIPYGTKVFWVFTPESSDTIYFISQNRKFKTNKQNGNFVFGKTFYNTTEYFISAKNKWFRNDSLLKLNVNVVPDLYPKIIVEQLKDTANFFISYFKGTINDDYGFKKLLFKFRVSDKNSDSNNQAFKTNILPVSLNQLKQTFYYAFNFNDLKISENQKIEYYFEVWDNDAVSGSKKSKTEIFYFEMPEQSIIDSLQNVADENINSKIEKSLNLAEEIKNDIRELREKNLNGNISDWENKQSLQSILNKQELLNRLTEEVAEENKQKNRLNKQLSEQDKELIKKQEEIQKLLDEVMTPELKKLMEQLKELQEKFNQKMMEKLLKENEFSYKEMSERLDRTKELLKKEQVEQKINKTINELNKLSKEQKKLSDNTKNRKLSKEELLKKQEELSEKFNKTMGEYNDALKKNEELKNKMKLDDFSEAQKDVQQEMQNSEENLSRNKNKKASQSQNNASQKIKKMADSMDSMMRANSLQQQGEDMEALRKILDNLINFSFKQEKLINSFKTVKNNDPKIISLFNEQSEMREDFQIINDSLKALAYRVPQINKPINDELQNISENLNETKNNLQERKIRQATINQNRIMTSANNLALLLSKILDQMKNSQQAGGSGKGSENPKSGKQKAMQDLKGMQESLKQQMEQMLKQMKEGKGQFNLDAQNKQLVKMLAQQEIFKQMLKELQSGYSLKSETQKLLNEINKMNDENKQKIINRQITPELLERQKKIETRLLEAEKAENKRKFDKKRESERPENSIYKSPEDVFKDRKKTDVFNDELYKKNIQLNNFYKILYNQYQKEIIK